MKFYFRRLPTLQLYITCLLTYIHSCIPIFNSSTVITVRYSVGGLKSVVANWIGNCGVHRSHRDKDDEVRADCLDENVQPWSMIFNDNTLCLNLKLPALVLLKEWDVVISVENTGKAF